MGDDMPLILYAGKSDATMNVPEKTINHGFIWCSLEQAPEGYPQMSQYTLTSHHAAEIEKRDRAIEECKAALEGIRTLWDVDCEDRSDDESVGWTDDKEMPVTFGDIRKIKAILGEASEPNR